MKSVASSLFLLSAIFFAADSYAQHSVGVPKPKTGPIAGIELSLAKHTQQGTYGCDCGAQFSGGTGSSFSGSAFLELPVIPDVFAGLKMGLDQKNVSSSYLINELVMVVAPGSEESPDTTSMLINRTGTMSLSSFRFEPFVQYQVFSSSLFIQLGAGISIVTASNFTQTRELKTTSLLLPDGTRLNNMTFTNGTRFEEVENGAISGLNNPEFSGLVSAGYNFNIGRSQLSPVVTYEYPFSTISPKYSGAWKISSLYGALDLAVRL